MRVNVFSVDRWTRRRDKLVLKGGNAFFVHDSVSDYVLGTPIDGKIGEMQMLATSMVACDISGGCGPDGLNVILSCLRYYICRPGMSMFDYWQTIYSPYEFNIASLMADDLRSRRGAHYRVKQKSE